MTRTTVRSGIRERVSRILQPVISKTEKKGMQNEQRAHKIAVELQEKGSIPHKIGAVAHLTDKWSKLDMAGYDLIIPTDLGDIGLQIKSSKFGMKQFIERAWHRDWTAISCVVVNKKMEDSQIAEEIRRLCWSEYYDLEEKMGRKY